MSDADGVAAFLGKAGLVQHEDARGRIKARGNISLQGVEDGGGGPRSLCEEALKGARGGAGDGFGEVLGVAAVGLLDQEATQILFAAELSFLAAEEGGEVLMKGGQ